MGIRFDFRGYEPAPKLPNSLGKAKGRLHFHQKGTYKFGEDKFAIAAKKLSTGEAPPKLNWFEKKIYILHKDEDSGAYYKINKLSLKKRLGVREKDLKEALKHAKLPVLIERKLAAAITNEAYDQACDLDRLKDPKATLTKIESLPDYLRSNP